MAAGEQESKMEMEETTPAEQLEDALEQASGLQGDAAVAAVRAVAFSETTGEGIARVKEQAILALGKLYAEQQRKDELVALISEIRPFFKTIAKAKTAKVVKMLIDQVATIPDSLETQVALCEESVEWCKSERRNFLRLRIQARLSSLLLQQTKYQQALSLIAGLLREVKRLDDKPLLVDIHLIESRTQHALRNMPKARAALTAARTAASSMYLGPERQSKIDILAGTLHSEDKDYRTAYSYFLEAFEGLQSLGDRTQARACLKYLVLCKIMMGDSTAAIGIINGKNGVEYAGAAMEAMRAVATAHQERSLEAFQKALDDHQEQLRADELLTAHTSSLYESLLEQNLQRIVEPFSRVEIGRVAELIQLPLAQVETKLAQMILDGKLFATLDQGAGHLLLFDQPQEDQLYTKALEVTAVVGRVVDGLTDKASKLQ